VQHDDELIVAPGDAPDGRVVQEDALEALEHRIDGRAKFLQPPLVTGLGGLPIGIGRVHRRGVEVLEASEQFGGEVFHGRTRMTQGASWS
jgi:hypothetical protein